MVVLLGNMLLSRRLAMIRCIIQTDIWCV